MKYSITMCKECIYTIEINAEDEDSAILEAEELFKLNDSFFYHVEDIIEAIDIKEIKE